MSEGPAAYCNWLSDLPTNLTEFYRWTVLNF